MTGQISRYLAIGQTLELKVYAASADSQVPEVYITLPVDVYWDLQQVIRRVNFERTLNRSGDDEWFRLVRLVLPYVVAERDRVWFKQNAI